MRQESRRNDGDPPPVPPLGTQEKKYLSVRQAAFIGVGAMVGAGIFALLGAAGEVAGAAVWLSFLIAGVVAGLQGYSFGEAGRPVPVGRGAAGVRGQIDRQRPASPGVTSVADLYGSNASRDGEWWRSRSGATRPRPFAGENQAWIKVFAAADPS